MATKAQIANLRWLIENYGDETIPSNALMNLYEARAQAEHEAEQAGKPRERKFGWRPTTNRRHAWRRTSGRVLGQMHRAGLLVPAVWDRYSPRYRVSAEGREAAREES